MMYLGYFLVFGRFGPLFTVSTAFILAPRYLGCCDGSGLAHGRGLGSTCSRTWSTRAFALGEPARNPMAETRGIPSAAPRRSAQGAEKPTRRIGCSQEGLREATATIWGKWQWKAAGWPERATNITAYAEISSSLAEDWPSCVAERCSSTVEDSCSRPLEMLVKPTSMNFEISGFGGTS